MSAWLLVAAAVCALACCLEDSKDGARYAFFSMILFLIAAGVWR